MSRNLIFILCCIFCLTGIPHAFAAGEGRPRYQTNVSYTAANWFSNDRILCVKRIDHLRLHYGLLADLSKRTSTTLKSEIQFVSMKLDGTEESILKNIVIKYKHEQPISSESALIGVPFIRTIDYNPFRHLIVFGEAVGERPGRLYLVNDDGTDLRKLMDSARAPVFSPDGRTLQYTSQSQVWLYDLETGEHRLLIDNALGGPFSPDGRWIAFSRKIDHQYDVFLYDMETKKETVIKKDGSPDDWSPDGSLLLIRGSLFKARLGEGINLERLLDFRHLRLRNGRFSFDGTKMVGVPLSEKGSIAVADLQTKELDVLR